MELIDREKLKVEICSACSPGYGLCSKDTCGLIQIVDMIPTADAVPRSEYERVCKERDAAKVVDSVPFNDYLEILTERNAAISDLAGQCECCKYVKRDKSYDACNLCCLSPEHKYWECCLSPAHKYWEWRGVDETN